MKKVLITGPESTGKSTLCAELAKQYSALTTIEFARDYLNKLKREYNERDLLNILEGQMKLECIASKNSLNKNSTLLFCDTGPEVMYVWSLYKYGRVHPEIISCFKKHTYDLVLLMDTDLPWQFDYLRENPNQKDRNDILKNYINLFNQHNIPFKLISGSEEKRLKNASQEINKIANESK